MDGVKRGDFMPGDVLVVESINRFDRGDIAAQANTHQLAHNGWTVVVRLCSCL